MDALCHIIGMCILGVLACGSLVIMGIASYHDQQVPASIAAAFGTCVGAVAGIISQGHQQNQRP